jgi:tRNA pseudouridine55 synthase
MTDAPTARIWLVDKPAGPTSHDIVRQVRTAFPKGVKVGHAGTLDPFATGLLIILVGRATRLARYLSHLDKTYVTRIALGRRSASGDPEGPVTAGGPLPDDAQIDRAVAELPGRRTQVVPLLSAVKVEGERLYRKARRGEEPGDRPRREIEIISAREVAPREADAVTLEVRCSKGTYIRQLAIDLGETLGCGAYCLTLRRTAVAGLSIDDAVPPGEVGPNGGLAPAEALGHMAAVSLTDDQARRVSHGASVPGRAEGPVLLTHAGRAVAVARCSDGTLQPEVVLA